MVERSIQRGASISQATPSQQSANGPLTEEPIHAGESDEPGESTRAVDKGQLAGLVGVATEYLEKKLSASSRPDEPDLFIPSPEDITDAQHAAALGEQIAHVLSRPDLIRQRAQHAAAICGAAATALGAFAALSGLERGTQSLIALGVALTAWLLSMGVYVHAITCSYTDKLRSEGHQRDAPENLDELVEQFRAEADFLRGGVGQGRRVTWAAIALTLAALALLVSGVFDATKVQVSLTAPAAASVANVCEWPTIRNPVDATIDRSSLDKRFVALEIHDCRGQQSIVRVRSAQIVTTRQ